jgi:hypothetical protein
MSILTIARFSRILCGTASLFTLAGVLATGSVARAQQATSQVLAFTGTMPGQLDGPVAIRLRLYDVQTGGAPLFEETQTVRVTSETFTLRIGDATAGGVPATLFRSAPSLWIAYALDVMPDSQIGLRTAITSGGYAHTAALLSGPMVRTVSGLMDDVTLAAGPNVTIIPFGNTLTIAADPGLASVSHDGTLVGDGTGSAPLGVAAPLQLTASSGATISGTNSSGRGVQGTSTTDVGVFGVSDSGVGVSGISNGVGGTAGVKGVALGSNGNGVWGVANAQGGFGVFGQSTSSAGVYGSSGSSYGVAGVSGSGYGVFGASSSSYAGYFSGKVRVTSIPLLPSAAQVCFNSAGDLLQCGSSSLRFKTNVHAFREGLDVVQGLRPISFDWKEGGAPDIGLAAEEVAQIAPSLTITNGSGEVQGVKYDRLNIVLINAIKEQQAQIQQQQRDLAALKALVCSWHQEADGCR